VLDYLREIIHSLNFVVTPVNEHVANNHKKLNPVQISEIKKLAQDLGTYLTRIATDINESNFNNLDSITTEQQKNIAMIDLFRKNEVKRIKKEGASTRNSLLYMTILQETKNLHLFALNLYKAQRDFVSFRHLNKDSGI
jgi:Na+/phosphate symporter